MVHDVCWRSLAVVFFASSIALGGCSAPDPSEVDEQGDATVEGLAGEMPVGTKLQTTGNLNLRSGPSTSSGILAVLPSGTVVTLQASSPNNGFYQVEHEGTLGWSSGKYLEPSGDGSQGSQGATLVATGDVNLRSGPSTSDSIIRVVPMGAVVDVVQPAPVNGFYNIDYQGSDGWSSGKYLSPTGSSGTSFAGGEVWKFKASTLAVNIAVFVPQAASQAASVDVLVYAHGLNVCSPVATNPPLSFVTDSPFELGEIVAASQKPVVLVVPWLDWEHITANDMAFNGKKHKLGIPKNLNGVVAEVLSQVGQHRGGAAPTLSNLILAGHSRAYDFLNPLAAAYSDPQMSSGALAKLSEVWCFDTGYVCSPVSNWSSWLDSKPSLEITMYYRAGTDTASCGQQFDALEPGSDGRLSVSTASEAHCSVPGKRLPALLSALP